MAKTDEHMQKVRKNLLAKQAAQARTEKVRQLRDQKKMAKRVQVCEFMLHEQYILLFSLESHILTTVVWFL